MIVVGVDPGGKYSGIVTRDGDVCSTACVITRTAPGPFPDQFYIHEVLDEISERIHGADVLALEGLVEPKGHNPRGDKTYMSIAGLIGTGMIFGAVIARWPAAIIVPPGGNGSLPDVAYPVAIRRYGRIGGPTVHARSAWDVAGAGKLLYRQTQRRAVNG